MTPEKLIPLMRDVIAAGRYLDAIRYARREGLTFRTARRMADEIPRRCALVSAQALPQPQTMNRTTPRGFTPAPPPPDHVRLIGHCTHPGCDYCRAVHIRSTVDPVTTARILDAGQLVSAYARLYCRAHPGARMSWASVQGTHSASRLCDPRCTGATGPVCVCQCAGANHGSAHL